MSLTGAKISEEVWLTCVTHALSTETEEIMGLLLGDIEHSSGGHATALVWGAAPQTRSDRRKDRVETNPEQLAAASAQAERMTAEIGKVTRVIGWYHSHPHITVLPSHVDVRTQGMYQLLDSGFLGLIFSCFNEDANKVGKIQATAFQASNGWQRNNAQRTFHQHAGIIQEVSSDTDKDIQQTSAGSSSYMPSNSDGVASINSSTKGSIGIQPDILESEKFVEVSSEMKTNDMSNVGMPVPYSNPGQNPGQATLDVKDMDSFDLTAGMQEAMHLSNLEMSGAEFVRKEVPFEVVPGYMLAKVDFPLSSLVSLQKILFEEEQAAYNQSLAQSRRNGKLHPLTSIHHSATYQASLCKLMEYCLSPVLSSLQDRLHENNIRISFLQEEAMGLQLQLLSQGTRQSVHPQRRSPSSTVRGNDNLLSSEKSMKDGRRG